MNDVKRACVYAHFDRDGIVDEYVRYYLACLQEVVEHIEFVTVSKLAGESLQSLVSMGINVTQRENVGYDFVSYKVGLSALDLTSFDEVVICNDSVYGPLFDLKNIFVGMEEDQCDFWGITQSDEIATHLQSYFLVFRKPVLDDESFREFWQRVENVTDKKTIIEHYEVGLSQKLLNHGFICASVVKAPDQSLFHRIARSLPQFIQRFKMRWKELKFYRHLAKVVFLGEKLEVNPTHLEWKTMLIEQNAPFLKIELLRSNPQRVAEVEQVFDVIASKSHYRAELILEHLKRVRSA
ncbi:MAG: rhamnosyltransferase [Halioglobus sp.]|jgi:rhamnosyltransferase